MIKNTVTAEINTKVEPSFLLGLPKSTNPHANYRPFLTSNPTPKNNSFIFSALRGNAYRIKPFTSNSTTLPTQLRIFGWSKANANELYLGVKTLWYATPIVVCNAVFNVSQINFDLNSSFRFTYGISSFTPSTGYAQYYPGSLVGELHQHAGSFVIDTLGYDLIEVEFTKDAAYTGSYTASAFVGVC